MRLTEIPELAALLAEPPASWTFQGVQCDSRRVRPGDVFVAISGSHEEGGRYASAALARGAVGVLSEEALPECPRRVMLVRDARQALAVLAAALNGWPARHLDLFGITGTNGKTTTAWLLHAILQAAGRNPGLLTTVQVAYADRAIPATRTTPDACELQGLLAAMRGAGCDSAVLEVSSHALCQQRVAGIPFVAAAFTNLSHDHLDYHGTMEAYFQAKQLLFRQLARERPGAPAVCNVDGEYGREMARIIRELGLRCVTCGQSPEAEARAEEIVMLPEGSRFVLALPGVERAPIQSRLAGRYNISNMLCAAALAREGGASLDAVVRALQDARPRWGRLQRVPAAHPAAIFVDYAHTDDALTQVLKTLRETATGRVIALFGCGGDRDRAKRPLMGRAAAAVADHLVLTSDNPRSEDPEQIIRDIAEGVPPGTAVTLEPDRREAIRQALSLASAGDTVLVAGKGHESFQEMGSRKVPFDDYQVILEVAGQAGGR